VTVRAQCFGVVAEALQTSTIDLTVDSDCTVEAFTEELVTRYPRLADTTFQVAVNRSLAESDTIIPEGAELAVLPPFAGG
jgi:molybdopterin converting factor small subunit